MNWLKQMVSEANSCLNTEKAHNIKKKLIIIGGVLLGVGILLLIVGMIIFISTGFSAINDMPSFPSFESPTSAGFNVGGIIAGIVVFMLGGFCTGFGSLILKAGIGIVIAAVGTKILDVDKSKICPKCGDRIEENELFCNKCGSDLRAKKKCSCGFQNDFDDKFCRKCGKNLD